MLNALMDELEILTASVAQAALIASAEFRQHLTALGSRQRLARKIQDVSRTRYASPSDAISPLDG